MASEAAKCLSDVICDYAEWPQKYTDLDDFKNLIAQLLNDTPQKERIEILKNSSDATGWTVFHQAAYQNHSSIITTMLSFLESTDRLQALTAHEFTPLHQAASSGHSETVKAILESLGVEEQLQFIKTKSKLSRTVFHEAAENGHADTISVILGYLNTENYVDILSQGDIFGKSAAHLAAQCGHTGALLSLQRRLNLDNQFKVMSIADQVGMTVLHRAAEMGFIDTVKELLGPLSTQQKAELIFAKKWDRRTAFHLASKQGHVNVVKELIDCMTSDGQKFRLITAADNGGKTAAHFATACGNTHVLEAILKCTSRDRQLDLLTMQTICAQTPLHLAAAGGYTETVNVILSAVSKDRMFQSITMQDKLGRTALHAAVEETNTDTLKALLDCQSLSDINRILSIENVFGTSVIQLAADRDKKDVSKLLSEYQQKAENADNERGGEDLPTGLGLDRYEKALMTVVVLQQRKKIHNLMSEVSKQAEMLAHIKIITTEDYGGGDEEAANRKITAIKELLKDIKVADNNLEESVEITVKGEQAEQGGYVTLFQASDRLRSHSFAEPQPLTLDVAGYQARSDHTIPSRTQPCLQPVSVNRIPTTSPLTAFEYSQTLVTNNYPVQALLSSPTNPHSYRPVPAPRRVHSREQSHSVASLPPSSNSRANTESNPNIHKPNISPIPRTDATQPASISGYSVLTAANVSQPHETFTESSAIPAHRQQINNPAQVTAAQPDSATSVLITLTQCAEHDDDDEDDSDSTNN